MKFDDNDKFLVSLSGFITTGYLLNGWKGQQIAVQVLIVVACILYIWMAIKIWLVKEI